ncbi:hypothetical protein Tco_0001907 [Tanacetum coccineum]
MANENVPAPAPTRFDDQILPFATWVPIRKSNYVLDLQKKQKNPISADAAAGQNPAKPTAAATTHHAIITSLLHDLPDPSLLMKLSPPDTNITPPLHNHLPRQPHRHTFTILTLKVQHTLLQQVHHHLNATTTTPSSSSSSQPSSPPHQHHPLYTIFPSSPQ